MSSTQRNTAIASATSAADAFLSLSRVYLTSVEAMTLLNLKASRDALDECASATRALSEALAAKDYGKFQSSFGQPMLEKAMTHSRNVCDVMTKAQHDMSAVIAVQLSHPKMAMGSIPDWKDLAGMFTQGFQQLAAIAEENVSAAAEAGSKAIAATSASARKAA